MPEYGQISYPRLDLDERMLVRRLRQTMTPTEARLWQALRANRLAGLHVRRQQVIAGFIVEVSCHEASLAVEGEGGVQTLQVEYDAERDRVLAGQGVRVLSVINAEVEQQLQSVLRQASAACGEALTPRVNTPSLQTSQTAALNSGPKPPGQSDTNRATSATPFPRWKGTDREAVRNR